MSRKIESLDIYEAKQIHEVDPLSSLTGREEILIDNGTLTFKATIDGLLGYFASRFVGNQDNEIDISALNSASCIHIIPPGKDIPVQERIKNHFYLKLDEAEIDAFYSALLQGHDESRYFLKTSKNNVEGLLYPDHYYINDHYYKYLKILTIEITNNEDPVYINETFDLNLVNQISEGYSSTIFNKVHFECLHTSGQYIENSIVIYCTDYMDTKQKTSKVFCVMDDDNQLTIWANITDINNVFINRTFSLSSDMVPSNKLHMEYGYIAHFMDNHSVDIDTDVTNIIDSLGTIIKQSVNTYSSFEDRVKNLESAILKADLDFAYNAVTFDDATRPETTEQQMNAILIKMIDTSKTFLIINDDGSVSVSKDGYYNIVLKQGFEVLMGSSTLEMNVYINSAKVADLSTKVTLSESFKMTYSTGSVTVRLLPTDKIKVTTKWSDSSVTISNETSLQISKYTDCSETLDFGTLDEETYPYVGYARVGSSRLLISIEPDEENGGELEVATYTLPLVDYAAADEAVLKDI